MWKFFPNSVYKIKSSLTAINNSQLLSPHCFMKVVAKGNANIVIDYGNPNWLYRCCVRYENSLKCNNDYSLENYQYIKSTVEPLLKGTLCDMELKTISLELLKPVISEYIAQMDDTKVLVIKMPNLKSKDLDKQIYADHYTKIYASNDSRCVLWEFKPKWLHSVTDYCRNCTHSTMKGREMRYCYALLHRDHQHLDKVLAAVTSIPLQCGKELFRYFRDDKNVLATLYEAQMNLSHRKLEEIESVTDVDEELLLAMTLKDVTCFIEWRSDTDRLRVNVVDADLKPKEKFQHWLKTHHQLEAQEIKHYH